MSIGIGTLAGIIGFVVMMPGADDYYPVTSARVDVVEQQALSNTVYISCEECTDKCVNGCWRAKERFPEVECDEQTKRGCKMDCRNEGICDVPDTEDE